MKRLKIILIALIAILGVMVVANWNQAYAEDLTRTLNRQNARPYSDDNKNSTVGDDIYQLMRSGTSGAIKYNFVKIFDTANTTANGAANTFTNFIYCLRGGKGFGNVNSDTGTTSNVTYTETKDEEMHKNSSAVIDKYNTLYGDLMNKEYSMTAYDPSSSNNTKTYTVNIYNAILWIADNAYLPLNVNNYVASEYKAELLDKVGIAKVNQSLITDDDLEVAQQLAFWYFANYDEQNAGNTASLSISSKAPFISGTNGAYINGYTMDFTRQTYLDRIYNYFVNNAIINSSKYGTNDDRSIANSDLKFDKTVTFNYVDNTYVDATTYCEIGPFKLTGTGKLGDSSSICLLDGDGNGVPEYFLNSNNGGQIPVFYVIDSNGNKIEKSQIQAGQEYKIRIYKVYDKSLNTIAALGKYNFSNFTLKISNSYTTSTAKFLKPSSNTEQALIEITKDKSGSDDTITTEKPGEFTLQLIKKDVDSQNNMNNVKFKLYAGSLSGTTFTKGAQIGNEYTTGTDLLQLLKESISKTATYKPGETYYFELDETTPSGYFDLGVTIIIEVKIGSDYTVTANLIDSTGKEITSLSNSQITDAVKISCTSNVISLTVQNKKKAFDLSLRKFIAKVNDTDATPSREPQIDLSKLNTTATDGKEITTAIYRHPKNTLQLKRGDLITYTIRVYNEGNVAGKVTEITDYLPENLELVTGDATNALYSWTIGTQITLSDGSTVTSITTNKLKDNVLKAYDTTKKEATTDAGSWPKGTDTTGTGLYYYDVQVVCKIKDATADNEILKNVAEITGATDSTGNTVTDRDSQPKNVYDDNEHKPGNETDGYTPGEQDDDDFEKVTVQPQKFDLALRKYITGLTDSTGTSKNIKNKAETADTRNLNNIDTNTLTTGGTTATYKHQKDPVVVETGDIVEYTFRVYNEGEIQGWVDEISDYLPEGIEFVPTAEYASADSLSELNTKYNAATTTAEEKTNIAAQIGTLLSGKKYLYKYDSKTRKLTITPEYNPLLNSMTAEGNNLFKLSPFDKTHEDGDGWIKGLNYGEVKAKFKVTATTTKDDQILTNVATMNYGPIVNNKKEQISDTLKDRDSNPSTFTTPTDLSSYKGNSSNKDDLTDSSYFYQGQEDDDDFEKLVLVGKPFDLALRKFITTVNGTAPTTSRKPQLDMTEFEKGTKTTVKYDHTKDPLTVKQGDIITYTIRVYNEGLRDGKAEEITDYLPEGLGLLVDYKDNKDNNWSITANDATTLKTNTKTLSELTDVYKIIQANKSLTTDNFTDATGKAITSLDDVQVLSGKVKITSNKLKDNVLKAYDKTKTTATATNTESWQQAEKDKGTTGLYYEDVQVTCVVLAPNSTTQTLRNIAEISKTDATDDRDSQPDNVDTENYTPPEDNSSYQQDDDDYEPIILQRFDLALRKFITGVNDKLISTRYPKLSIDDKGNIKYTHPKEEAPVEVVNNDVVTYTIRVYNEGTKEGYADLVADDIPEGLVFLPDNATNKENRWVMYRLVGDDEKIDDTKIVTIDGKKYVETKDASEASVIQTDYLSKEQGEARMKTDTTLTENPNLLAPFNLAKGLKDGNPDYADIKVAFKVTEPNTSDRVLVNSAQITHDTDKDGKEVTDEDSETNKWNNGEDDQDKEYIKVKYFDLSLYKWITKTIVTVGDQTTTTETGFKPNIGKTENITKMDVRQNSEKEPIAAVTLDKKKLSSTTVKFAYNIMVMNEGEIAGYASEITDYIPEGLEFDEEDNSAYGWTQSGDNKITTRCLESTLLQPGESTTVEVVFRWKNSADNLGLKTNIAEISEDYNDSGSKDIDSTPGNKKDEYKTEQEDDDDFALALLEIKTGSAPTYIALVTGVLVIIAGGTILIKRYVL
jgi:uncharacterized repeat protein (TIGR01451 family)